MMLGAGGNTTGTSVLGSSGDGAGTGGAPTIATTSSTTSGAHEGSSEAGLVGPLSGEEDKSRVIDEGDRTFGGNRWPRQETLALLKIRSDMDVAFRDATVKGPLWEEVSRKLAELGYVRSAKKCKEKFENVYKYHKRTKEGRTGKPDGKTYRFFDQLQALENHPSSIQSHQQKPQSTVMATTTMAAASNPPSLAHVTVPSTTTLPSLSQNIVVTAPTMNLTVPSLPPANPTIVPLPPPMSSNPTMNPPPASNTPSSFLNIPADLLSNSTSSSTSSDVELGERRKRKRKWKDFFEGLMREVIAKQEELHRRFLEAIEKREHDRMVREEAWRMQEMSRINREREILAQERSITAAKDAAVMAFLQKLSEQQNLGQVPINLLQPLPQPQPQMQQQQPPPPAPPLTQPAPAQAQPVNTHIDTSKKDNGDQNFPPASSSRWPKVEVQALIRLRTDLDSKYQDSGPKGPLWEEISAGMRKLGYNRNAKRCKEKWENINKYFKKVKESNKKRPEDSKTCPYFHQLDALYREKNKLDMSSNQIKPENSVPLMVRPEQQWPPPPPLPHEPDQHRSDNSAMEDLESEHMDQNHEDDDKDGDDEEDDEGGDDYEIVAANRTVSVGTSHE